MENKTEKIITNNRIPFSQRLFWSIFFIFLGFTGCVLIFQYQRETEFAQEKLDTVLKTYNHQIHYRIQHEKTHRIDSIIHAFLNEIPQKDIRVTVINPDGDVLFDNSGNDIFENHNDRSEVHNARLTKKSFAIRKSRTTGKRYFYSASNINNYVYRTAIPYDPYVKGVLAINKDFIYFMGLMVVIFLFVLSKFTLSIGQTISKLRDFARNIRDVKQDDEDYNSRKRKTIWRSNGKRSSNISNIHGKALPCSPTTNRKSCRTYFISSLPI